MASGGGAAFEELPHDGTCDECEPDEAPGAEEVCRECGFCYCRHHAEAHGQKFPRHHLAEYVHCAAQAWTPGARGDGAGEEAVEAPVENEKALENEAGEGIESEEDSEPEEESETEEESEDESEEDSEEEMEDEQESEAEEDNQEEGESEAEGETEAESEFDPEIEMEAERVAKRKCPDHGLDLSTYCQEDKQLICVLCPVIGAHHGHHLSTLDEAFEELRSKDSGGLKAAMIELVERLKFKSSDPKGDEEEPGSLYEAEVEVELARKLPKVEWTETSLPRQRTTYRRLSLRTSRCMFEDGKDPVAPMKTRAHEGPPSPVEHPPSPCVYVTACEQRLLTPVEAARQATCFRQMRSQTCSRHRALQGMASFTVTDRASHSLVVVGKGKVPPCSTRSNYRVLRSFPQQLL
ncbi:tripartite motif-containing protein 44 isoform X2 [Bos indicus]|uniref:Tripartite motif-containing protein 44 isoform X2 n=1 Tax=Bos indicus TaxID=9915 RepID=A0ABM4TJC5_BOSIN|nr:tripartite motif-containing protein 44 isoform X2 [Bos taurus]